ncbi:MAG: RMD1 family protein [Candidatus Tectomicrobia bacterium]|nr:RMD1 family protein [Candidatus Tectomicrobia bacterium]
MKSHYLLFSEQRRIRARAWFLGERIDARALEQGEVIALAPLTVRAGKRGCAMLFRYGVVVLVELRPDEEAAFLEALASLVSERFDNPESEEAEIAIEPDRDERVDASGTLILREASIERLQVVAHILAKSVVLAHYEARVAGVFDRIEPLAERLQRGGRITAPGHELLRQIGDVLLTQTRTVGRVEVAEKPEITWDQSDLDRLYERLRTEYELRDRDLALSRKLELISRTAGTLLDLLQNRQALRVEWYIVILILVEIVLIVYEIFLTR